MKLRVLAISDLHGCLPEITVEADILLIAGDTIPLRYQFHKPNSKKWFESEFANWIKSLPVKHVYLIAGNHDAYFEGIKKSNVLALSQACGNKLTYLCNEVAHYIDDFGRLWSVFGTPYCHIFGNWPFMRSEKYMTEKFSKIPDKVDIIISHDPPFAFGDADVILEAPVHRANRMFKHLGNEPLGKRLAEVDYKLLVCGHIHSGDHVFNNNCRAVNVSHLDEYYTQRYQPFYIELEYDNRI